MEHKLVAGSIKGKKRAGYSQLQACGQAKHPLGSLHCRSKSRRGAGGTLTANQQSVDNLAAQSQPKASRPPDCIYCREVHLVPLPLPLCPGPPSHPATQPPTGVLRNILWPLESQKDKAKLHVCEIKLGQQPAGGHWSHRQAAKAGCRLPHCACADGLGAMPLLRLRCCCCQWQQLLTSCQARGCRSRGWLRGPKCEAWSARRKAGREGGGRGQVGRWARRVSAHQECTAGLPSLPCVAALQVSLPAGRRSLGSLAAASKRPAAATTVGAAATSVGGQFGRRGGGGGAGAFPPLAAATSPVSHRK